jgi:DNA invertase Pin-like site-specific DNA recombinase
MRTTNPDTHLSKKVAGYVRVSTFEQAEKGTSIDEQKRIIRQECLTRDWQLVKIYSDEGASGKLINRQGLQDLQRDANMGLFQAIMFTKSDRLTRSIRDLSNLWHDWTEVGLEIICVEQPEINSKGIYGKMMRHLLGIFAEWERDAISERTASGRMVRWRNTEAIMGALPYGYEFDRDNRKIVFNPEKIIICKRIFKMYLHQKLSTREIAIRLSKASVTTPRGSSCRWQYATINKILKNPAYTGKAEYNMYKYVTLLGRNDQQYTRRNKEKKDRSKWITIIFPAIISKDNHRRILDRMKLNSSVFNRGNRCFEKFFLLENTRFVCGECGGKMNIHVLRKKGRTDKYYTYYRCRWNSMSRKELASLHRSQCRCDMRVDANTLDNFVFGHVMEFLGNMVTFARRGLTDLSLQKITERVQSWHTTLSTEKVSFQGENGECDRIVGWEIAKSCDSELKYINKCKLKYSINSKPVKKELDYSKHQFNKINEFDKNVLRIRSERVIRSEPNILSAEISGFTERMTIEQKKCVLESVVTPEYGGKCIIRWAMPSDSSDSREELSSKKIKRYTRGVFRNEPQSIEITFYADLSRIQTLIWGTAMDILSQPLE